MVEQIVGQRAVLNLLGMLDRESVLLVGPAGTGKTKIGLAYLSRFGKPLVVNCSMERPKLIEAVTSSQAPTLLDEAHLLRQPEWLYPLLDAKPSFLRPRRPFALTTTDETRLPVPLRSRLVQVELECYTTDELAAIGVINGLRPEVAAVVASVARGIPRRVVLLSRIVKKARDGDEATAILQACGYLDGLSPRERRYLEVLGDSPKSLTLLANMLGMSEAAVRELEAELIGMGLVAVGPRGRSLARHPFTR